MSIYPVDERREAYVHELGSAPRGLVDPVTLEIIHNRLEAIANEMGVAVHNTAHTAIFAETKDFSCAIFDFEGHMVATGEFLPVHQAGAQAALDGLIREVGLAAFQEGDVYMTNDVLYGAWHTPDITLYAPVFHAGELVAITGVVVHHIDMGGMAPSSYCPQATELYQEGIRFPPTTKLFDRGQLRRDILNIFLTNVRTPRQQQGDLMAQVAGLHAGGQRLQELIQKYGAAVVKDAFLAIQANSARALRDAIRRLPDGVYAAEDFIDGDGRTDKSYRVSCEMTVAGESLTLDFTGTDGVAEGFINSHWGNTVANAYPAVWSYLIPYLPKNYGATVPITVITEKGSLVNATGTVPVGACTTETGYAIHGAVHLCLAAAYPEQASGVWGGTVGIPLVWGDDPRTGERFVTLLESGTGMGGGARLTMDGWPTASLKGSNITLPNIEIEEQVYPLLYHYRRLSRDDEPGGGGAGRMRGGPACNFEVQPLFGPIHFTTIVNKRYHPAAGVFGGRPGGTSWVEVRDARTGEVRRVLPPKIMSQPLGVDETLHFVTSGGGGYGDPLERDPEAVLKDVIEGFIAPASAEKAYGVVIDPESLTVDPEQTAALRRTLMTG